MQEKSPRPKGQELGQGFPFNHGLPSTVQSIAQEPIDLVQELQAWALDAAIKPMHQAALLLGLVTVSGVCARAYNIEGTGLNQYYILISGTGTGKGIISKCFNKLFDEVARSVPAISDLRGFGHIGSGEGIIKWLSDRPAPIAICNLDEIGHDFKEMVNPRNQNAKAKEKVLLQLWGLSGAGNVFDPMAYSDKDKNTNSLHSPALTISGTTTANVFNQALDESIAANGMLARLFMVENEGEIPPDNEGHEAAFNNPPARAIALLADITAHVLRLTQMRQVQAVAVTPEAKAHFSAYGEALRQRLNATAEGTAKQLYNRNREKALKLAATVAIGRNYLAPCVGIEQAAWATGFVDSETHRQFAKFANGDIGEVAGNQSKQQSEVRRIVKHYLTNDWTNKYHGSEAMHKAGVITLAHIQKRLAPTASFREPGGPTAAINRTIKTLLESDILREIPQRQMVESFGTQAKAYAVSDPKEILATP